MAEDMLGGDWKKQRERENRENGNYRVEYVMEMGDWKGKKWGKNLSYRK